MCAQTSDAPGASQQVAALDQFLAVQAQRAQHYRRFDEAHRAFLRTKAEGPYRCAAVRQRVQCAAAERRCSACPGMYRRSRRPQVAQADSCRLAALCSVLVGM